MDSDRLPWRASGRFTRIGYTIAGWLRMDTQSGLKRIAVVLAVVAEYDFPTVSRQSIIHSDNSKGGTTL
jgi:hypothetical protein